MDERLHSSAPRRLTWRTLGEFTLRAAPGSDRRAAEGVARIVRELSVPPEFAGRIGAAVAGVMLNVIKRDDGRRPKHLVSIRVQILQAQTADAVAKHSERGWGFFLIRKTNSSLHVGQAGADQIIELFLYPEGDARAADAARSPTPD